MNSHNPLRQPGLIFAIASFAAAPIIAQGEDCASAVSITGVGDFAFDLTPLAQPSSGMEFDGVFCSPYISVGFETFLHDGVFEWTVPADGDYRFETSGNASNGLMALYQNVGCTTSCLGFTHDGGFDGLLVQVSGLVAGESILIQLGTRLFPGSGVLNIRHDFCSDHDNDIYEPNNACETPALLTPGYHTRFYIEHDDPDFFTVDVPPGYLMTVDLVAFTSTVNSSWTFNPECRTLPHSNDHSDFEYFNSTSTTQNPVIEIYKGSSTNGCGLYDLNVSLHQDPCALETDDAFEDNDSCGDPWMLGDGTYTDLWLSAGDPDFYAVAIPAGATFQASFTSDPTRTPIQMKLSKGVQFDCIVTAVSPSSSFGYTTPGHPNISWTNDLGQEVTLYLEVTSLEFDPWSMPLEPHCNTYDLTISGTTSTPKGWLGTPWCAPMNINSTGQPTLLVATDTSPTGTGANIGSLQGPPGMFAHMFVGSGIQSPGVSVGNGRLCVGTSGGNVIGRYNIAGTELNSLGIYDAAGRFQNLSNTSHNGYGFDMPTTVPYPGHPTVESGRTYNFQLWHREPNGESNLSNALRLEF